LKKRSVLLVLAALGTCLAAVVAWRHARGPAPVKGPIILISIDTLRADHLPAYGYRKVKTPAIDALAADGVVFERAYSHAPQTLPSHTSILSGRLPFETGVRDNLGFTVKRSERLLPQMLRERGYKTGGVVSAYVLRRETGIDQGFDFFDDQKPPSSPEITLGELQRDGGDSEQIAERWLDRQASPRIFLFLHLYEPHKPYTPPARFAEYAPYDGEIAYSDEIVGRLIGYLRAHQIYDASTIVLLSDHGEGLGDHGEQEHGLFLYDETIHVPLIIKQPGGIGRGRRVADLVQHIDIVPTLLDLVDAPLPPNLRGRTLRPVLDGSGHLAGAGIYAEALYARYHFGWSELTALTDGRYRYIKAPREELYDLDHDPHERDNIAGQRPPAQQALRGALDRLVAGAPLGLPAAISAEDRKRLMALGYVGAQTEVATTAAADLPDPKDKREILERYRASVDLAAQRKWGLAMSLLQQILVEDPGMGDIWGQLAVYAVREERYAEALDAYKHAITLRPSDPTNYIGAAAVLLVLGKLDEAREHATMALRVAGDGETRERVEACEQLARIALAKHDAAAARRAAELAQQADPTLPMPAYIAARLLYDQGKYADALPLFQQAVAGMRDSRSSEMLELHFYTADTLARLDRTAEAEREFVEELHYFPQNTRARASLAFMYQSSGRTDAAARVLDDMLRITPTPPSYALAERVWTMFGNRQQAEAVRARARQTFEGARERQVK
jgi:arylsulfatase A-like enzyme/Flp pilus assembly protein TadD